MVSSLVNVFSGETDKQTKLMEENGYNLFKHVGVNQIFVKNDFKLQSSSDSEFEGILTTVGFKRKRAAFTIR